MYNLIREVIRELDEEFNPLRLRYWKPSKPEIIMILIFLSVLYFGYLYVWNNSWKCHSLLYNTLYLRQYNTGNYMIEYILLFIMLLGVFQWIYQLAFCNGGGKSYGQSTNKHSWVMFYGHGDRINISLSSFWIVKL